MHSQICARRAGYTLGFASLSSYGSYDDNDDDWDDDDDDDDDAWNDDADVDGADGGDIGCKLMSNEPTSDDMFTVLIVNGIIVVVFVGRYASLLVTVHACFSAVVWIFFYSGKALNPWSVSRFWFL